MLLKQQRELLQAGIITREQLSEAVRIDASRKEGLLQTLLDMDGVDERKLLGALSRSYKVPFLNLDNVRPTQEAIRLCPEKLCQDYCFVPVDVKDKELIIATDNPVDYSMLDALRFKIGRKIRTIFARPDQIRQKIREIYQGDSAFDAAMEALDQSQEFEAEAVSPSEQATNIDDLKRGAADSPIVKLVNGIIVKALKLGSSDIHLEAGERSSTVRLRLDGRLKPVLNYPVKLHPLVVTRIKILSRLDISKTRVPQDGRTRVRLAGKHYDLRVSTLPAMHGEKVVLRVLDKSALSLKLESLGFEPRADERVRQAIARPTGAVLVTGPTGSGKTTTLYSFLNHIHDEETNIITVEDPVEYQIPGINQIEVNPKAGLSFPAALRSILRQDPDVVMIGEIRDHETAEIALHAAQTGHLVLSTLHTNDAPSAIDRLHEFNLDPALIASSVNMVVAQRLVRRLCRHCRRPGEVREEWRKQYGIPEDVRVYHPAGCEKCGNTGFRGRLAIHEVLYLSDTLREMINRHASIQDLREAARRENMLTLFEDGLAKVLKGLTSLREVLRNSTPPEGFSLKDQLAEDGSLLALGEAQAKAAAKLGASSDEMTILIVDDSASIRNLLSFVLQASNYRVLQAEDGLQAWQMMQQQKPSLVISDFEMPNMDGPTLVQRMRSFRRFDDVPFIMLTARKDEEDEVLGLETGADDYIAKPIEPMKLQARVKKVLEMYRRIRISAVQESG